MPPLAEAFRRYRVLKALVQEDRDRALRSPEDPKDARFGIGDPVNFDELAGFFDQLINRVDDLGFFDVVSSFEDTFRGRLSAGVGAKNSKLRSKVSAFLRKSPGVQTLGAMRPILKLLLDQAALATLDVIKDERNRIAHGRLSSQGLSVSVEDTLQALEDVLLRLS